MEKKSSLTFYLPVGRLLSDGVMTVSRNRDTKNEILILARDLLQSRGFSAFSYKDIADGLGIRKASIHYHFPTKDDLGIALLDTYREHVLEWANSERVVEASPEKKLEYLFEVYRKIVDTGKMICPSGMFSSEWNNLSEGLKGKLKELMGEHRRWLVKVIRDGRENGDFSTEGDPVDLARLVYAGIQGAVQISRVQGDPSMYDAVARQLKSLVVGSSRPAP